MSHDSWPVNSFGGARRVIVNAEVHAEYGHMTFQAVFRSSSGDSLTVQLPDTVLRSLAKTALEALGDEPKAKAPRPGKPAAKPRRGISRKS